MNTYNVYFSLYFSVFAVLCAFDGITTPVTEKIFSSFGVAFNLLYLIYLLTKYRIYKLQCLRTFFFDKISISFYLIIFYAILQVWNSAGNYDSFSKSIILNESKLNFLPTTFNQDGTKQFILFAFSIFFTYLNVKCIFKQNNKENEIWKSSYQLTKTLTCLVNAFNILSILSSLIFFSNQVAKHPIDLFFKYKNNYFYFAIIIYSFVKYLGCYIDFNNRLSKISTNASFACLAINIFFGYSRLALIWLFCYLLFCTSRKKYSIKVVPLLLIGIICVFSVVNNNRSSGYYKLNFPTKKKQLIKTLEVEFEFHSKVNGQRITLFIFTDNEFAKFQTNTLELTINDNGIISLLGNHPNYENRISYILGSAKTYNKISFNNFGLNNTIELFLNGKMIRLTDQQLNAMFSNTHYQNLRILEDNYDIDNNIVCKIRKFNLNDGDTFYGGNLLSVYLNKLSIKNSSSSRFAIWSTCKEIISDSFLFGVGANAWPFVYLQYRNPGSVFEFWAHNDLLEALCEFGVLGLLIIANLYVHILLELSKKYCLITGKKQIVKLLVVSHLFIICDFPLQVSSLSFLVHFFIIVLVCLTFPKRPYQNKTLQTI